VFFPRAKIDEIAVLSASRLLVHSARPGTAFQNHQISVTDF
jgi:hypothetical protein